MEITIPVRDICGTSSNDQPNPGQRIPSYQEGLLLLQVVAKGNVSWARVATPQLLNSVVNVDDVMQKIGSHLRLRLNALTTI